MLQNIPPRFSGTARLYGIEGFNRFQKAHICVVGIGGVGSWVAEALARSAVGEITLIDLDEVCVTNTNRQVHALKSTVGESKVEVMAQRLRDINPDIICHEEEAFVSSTNLQELITKEFTFVVDAIDEVTSKAALIAYCRRNKVPVISIGGAGGLLDPTQIQVADLSNTYQDPLAATVRSTLRRDHGFPKNIKRRFNVPCVFSTEQLTYPQPDGSACRQKKTAIEGVVGLDCSSGFGASTCVTASFAFVAVARVLEKIVKATHKEQAKL